MKSAKPTEPAASRVMPRDVRRPRLREAARPVNVSPPVVRLAWLIAGLGLAAALLGSLARSPPARIVDIELTAGEVIGPIAGFLVLAAFAGSCLHGILREPGAP